MIKKITPLFIFFISISFFAQNTTTLDAERDKTELLIGFNRRSDGPSAGAPFWTDPTFKPLLATMNPDIVRYPGGTQANYWDWSIGEFIPNSGKNMNSKEVVSVSDFVSALPARTKTVYVVNIARPTPATGVDVNATEAVLKSTATLNLKITDMLAAIAEFVTQGKIPYAVEVGNEFYFGNEEGGIFEIVESGGKYYSGWDTTNNVPYEHNDKKLATETNAKFYLDQCKEVVSQIIAVYPTMKFALVTTRRGNGTSSRESWNNTIYDELQNNATYATLKNDVYALTQHHYITNKYPTDPADETPISDNAGAVVAIADGITYPRDKQADYDQNPSQYKIWYTEYGATKENAEETWAGGLRAAATTLSFIDRGDKVGQLDYHHVTDQDVVNTTAASMRFAPVGITSYLFSMASADMTTMQKINFNTNPDAITGVESLYGYKFKSSEKETLVILNIDENAYANIKVDNLFTYINTMNLTQYWSTQPYVFGVYQGHSNIQSQTNTVTTTFNANMFSMIVIEVLNPILAVDDNEFKGVFELYPNPVTNIVLVSTQEKINEIQIFDVTGKQVLVVKDSSTNIDVSQLKPSIYFVKISTDKGVLTKKLIKN